MEINTQTKLIGRFHTDDNGTGLNIYNPYFEAQNLNVVYALFRSSSCEPLVNGMRNLGLTGAITAGFEHDATLPTLLDEVSEAVKVAGRVAMIANKSGKLFGHYQGGEGLMSAIQEKVITTEKRLVIVGAGTVAKTLVLALSQSDQKPGSIVVVNRTVLKAEELANNFELVKEVGDLHSLDEQEGDILVNATRIGSAADDNIFVESTIERFGAVADVTFGSENTQLISTATNQSKIVISGWDMFTHQAAVVLREILRHEADIERLRYFVRQGLSVMNHGAVAK